MKIEFTEQNFNKLLEENRMLKSDIQNFKIMRQNLEKNYKETNKQKEAEIDRLKKIIGNVEDLVLCCGEELTPSTQKKFFELTGYRGKQKEMF